jgi:hypothetical protein
VSNEGVTVTSRVVLVIVLTIATAFVRVLVGLRRRRGLYMGLGTLGGILSGVAVASALSPSNTTDVSVMAACLGIFAGWGVAWLFARHLTRERNDRERDTSSVITATVLGPRQRAAVHDCSNFIGTRLAQSEAWTASVGGCILSARCSFFAPGWTWYPPGLAGPVG